MPTTADSNYYPPQHLHGFAADTTGPALPAARLPQLTVMREQPALPAESRPEAPLHDTPTMALLLTALLFLLLSYRSGYKYVKRLGHNMFSVRRRENMFDDNTAHESKILASLIAVLSIAQGLLLYEALPLLVPSLAEPFRHHVALHVGLLAGIAVVFYLSQLAVYRLIAYVFADKPNTRLWLGGFKATQAALALALVPVVGCLLVAPAFTAALLILSAILYIAARIVFICKGFRIFRGKMTSYVRFFLYLCTLEIVPPVIALAGAIFLSSKF